MVRIIKKFFSNENAVSLICSKVVGKCTLEKAVVVPNDCVNKIQSNLSSPIYPSNSCDVRIIIDNQYYNCKLLYANPKDRKEPSLQFRYTPNSEISNKLKQLFQHSYNKFIEKNISLNNNSVCCENTLLNYDLSEELYIYSTDKKDVFLLKYSNVYNRLAA